jgi:hypothetical protein
MMGGHHHHGHHHSHGRRNPLTSVLQLLNRRKRPIIIATAIIMIILWFYRSDPYKFDKEMKWVAKTKWTAQNEAELKSKIAIGIISSKNYHPKLNAALHTWITPERQSMIEVFSDSSDRSSLVRNVKVTNTGCENTYTLGLWCKNMMMFRSWKYDARYKDVQWFFRAMDDTWVHLENLLDLSSKYDPSVPMLIGEKVCYWTGTEYPDGGPGFLMSRGFIEKYSESLFNSTLDTHEGETLDDIMFGQFLSSMHIKVTHHPGITHASLEPYPDSTYNYYLAQKGKPWPLTHRPVASHQGTFRGMDFMPRLNYEMHQIDFNNLHPNPVTVPDCNCGKGRVAHSRCSYAPNYPETDYGRLIDQGPGPWR